MRAAMCTSNCSIFKSRAWQTHARAIYTYSPPPPPPPHTHSHAHTRTHTHTHARVHTHTHPHAVEHGQVERGHSARRVAERDEGLELRERLVRVVRRLVHVDDLVDPDLQESACE